MATKAETKKPHINEIIPVTNITLFNSYSENILISINRKKGKNVFLEFFIDLLPEMKCMTYKISYEPPHVFTS